MTKDQLAERIESANKIVFFGGAGVSTESGLRDFRSADGLYNQAYAYPPEQILSHDFFFSHAREFYDYYFDKMINTAVKPNHAHCKLAELETQGKILAIVTQNIDGLHQAAGSKKVFELHGTVHSNHCTNCNAFYTLEDIINRKPLPVCDKCGAIIKPDVVLYGEALPDSAVTGAAVCINSCDLLIVGGTSLTVYPAAAFVRYTNSDNIVVINREPLDGFANQIIGDIGKIL